MCLDATHLTHHMSDWANTKTGARLKEDDVGAHTQKVLKRCPKHFDLLDIVGTRALAVPPFTNQTLDLTEAGSFDVAEVGDDMDKELSEALPGTTDNPTDQTKTPAKGQAHVFEPKQQEAASP